MFFLFGLQFTGLELAEKAVEALEVALPNPPVPLEPGFQLLERRGAQSVNAALGVDANVDESGVAEDAQVFRDLGLAETQAADQVADRPRPVAQKFDDMKTVGLSEGPEGCQHGDWNMPHFVYSRQGIFAARNA
jgi:hypothetical protein